MSQRTAILADIHGNSPALRAVLDDLEQESCTQVFVLGDIINGVDPHGCVELLKNRAEVVCIKGNAELYTLTPDLASFPDRDNPFYDGLIELLQWFIDHLTKEDLHWLEKMPDYWLSNGICMVHDSPVDRLSPSNWHQPGIGAKYQELYYHSNGLKEELAQEEWDEVQACMEKYDIARLFCGHTHVPFQKRVDGRLVCNVGSVGMPLDSDPRPSWALVESLPELESEISLRRVEYDLDQIIQLIDRTPDYYDFRQPGMRAAYKKGLQTGTHWKFHLGE